MEQVYKNCQSCGTEANGTRSTMYCSHCYHDGKFVIPDISVEQMQERVKERMKVMGFPGFLTGFFTRGIPNLQRWKN